MAKLPSFNFYPGDWQKEPSLRRCSKAAKGVLVDMLCLMFECEDRGVLSSGGKPWQFEEVAAAIGGDIAENLTCVMELLEKGVISRNGSGAIFSRRMVRDEQERKANAERQRRHRNGHSNAHVTPFNEIEGEDENERIGKALGIVVEFCVTQQQLPESDGAWFFHKCQANGWTNGGKPIRDWRATIRAWKAAGYMPSQKAPVNGSTGPARRQMTAHEINTRLEAVNGRFQRIEANTDNYRLEWQGEKQVRVYTPKARAELDQLKATKEQLKKMLTEVPK